MNIPEIQKIGEAFYAWADGAFFDEEEGWPPAHPWGTCTYVNEVARVLLERHGYKSSIIGLPDNMMPEWWQERYPTGHDWARTECGVDVDLWPLLYGEPGFHHPPLPSAAVLVYGYEEHSYARPFAIADLEAWEASSLPAADAVAPELPGGLA